MRQATINLEYQPYIEHPPASPQQLYAQAASNDGPTINYWEKTWIANTTANRQKFGSFADKSVGKLHGLHAGKAAILVGSGPSLKHNANELLANKSLPVISCLHNFHYLEDLGVNVDFYVSLDAGEIVISEVYDGGKHDEEHYWARTKDKKLVCYIGTSPKLLEKWRGEVYFFNAPVPSEKYMKSIAEIEKFNCFISNGGNVLGACTYFAKAFLGCQTLVFCGADFSFSYDCKFHGWDSRYDANTGHTISMRDVYGIPVKTWQSYANFKAWFDWLAQSVPGIYINATEGGTFGAYNEGNIRAVIQMELGRALKMFHLQEDIREQSENPTVDQLKLLF